jgi:hypothetical protein
MRGLQAFSKLKTVWEPLDYIQISDAHEWTTSNRIYGLLKLSTNSTIKKVE